MFKILEEATTPAEMRAAIEDGRYHNAVIHTVLMMAHHHGMTAEDTYSALAYHALQSMIRIQQEYTAVLATIPMPPMMIPAAAKPPEA